MQKKRWGETEQPNWNRTSVLLERLGSAAFFRDGHARIARARESLVVSNFENCAETSRRACRSYGMREEKR